MIVCVVVSAFAITLQRQVTPEYADVPLILAKYGQKQGRVLAFSDEARAFGVEVGMTLARARAVYPQASLLTPEPHLYEHGLERLLEILWAFTNRIEVDERSYPQDAVCYLDVGRLRATDLTYFCTQLASMLTAAGFTNSVGVASGKFPAFVAAQQAAGRQPCIVPQGQEAEFIAPFSVHLLPLSREAQRKLTIFHIHTLGEFARLPSEGLLSQFGKQGKLLYQLAHGRDGRPIKPRQLPQMEVVQRKFEDALVDRLRLDVILHDMAGELEVRLETRHAAFHEIRLTVTFEHDLVRTERLHVLEPTASANGIARTLQQLLARVSIEAGITEIAVGVAHFAANSPRQLDLFSQKRARQALLELVPALKARHGACIYEATLADRTSLLPERRFTLTRADVS